MPLLLPSSLHRHIASIPARTTRRLKWSAPQLSPASTRAELPLPLPFKPHKGSLVDKLTSTHLQAASPRCSAIRVGIAPPTLQAPPPCLNFNRHTACSSAALPQLQQVPRLNFNRSPHLRPQQLPRLHFNLKSIAPAPHSDPRQFPPPSLTHPAAVAGANHCARFHDRPTPPRRQASCFAFGCPIAGATTANQCFGKLPQQTNACGTRLRISASHKDAAPHLRVRIPPHKGLERAIVLRCDTAGGRSRSPTLTPPQWWLRRNRKIDAVCWPGVHY